MSDLRFDDRVAVITGAGRGLGRAYALLLAARGARIVVNDTGAAPGGEGMDVGPAEEVVREIRAAGGDAVACTASVATPAGGKAIVDAALERWGRLDIVIHNAGNTRRAPLKEMTQEIFNAVLDVHLHGAFHVVQPAFVEMCRAGYGRVVLTSSIGGLYGDRNVANYCTAKAGLMGLSNVLAIEGAAEGVKSNVILPVAVTRLAEGRDTSSFPPTTPEMVAPVVGLLAHESCPISGQMLISAAGRVAKAYVAETPGVFHPQWSIEQVAGELEAICNATEPLVFPPVPTGFYDHLKYSFEMAKKG